MIKAKKRKNPNYGKLRVFGWGGFLKIFEMDKSTADELTKGGVTYRNMQEDFEYGGEADFHGDIVDTPLQAFYGDEHYLEIDKLIESSLNNYVTKNLKAPRTCYLIVSNDYKGELFSQMIGDVFNPDLLSVEVEKYLICGKHEATTTTIYYDGKTGSGSIVDKGTDFEVIYPGGKSHPVKFIKDDEDDESDSDD
jgi:hypothetical protein